MKIFRNKINRLSLILSPIIALYGVAPLSLFNRMSFIETILFFVGLTLNILFTWLFIFYLIKRFPKCSNLFLFLSSLIVGIILRLGTVGLINLFVNNPPTFQQQDIFYLIITSLAINIILIVIIKSFLTSHQKSEVEKHLQEVKLENTEAQLKNLMQQLQPHFLFNSLSVLKSMIGENAEKAENYVLRLSDFLRYSVQATRVELISLEEELNFTKDYIVLQKERFEDGFDYEIEVENHCLTMRLPVMALQTLVENIFKHNYFTKQKPLIFTIKTQENNLIIENSKTSLRLTERTQTGLYNLNKRFELLVGKSIAVAETDHNFIVKLPLLSK